MFHSLRSKLLIFFLILSLGGILLLSFGVYYGFQETFQEYLEKNRESQIEQVKEQLENEWIGNGNGTITDHDFMMMLHHLSVNENLYFRVETNEGVILDTTNMGKMGGNMNHHGMRGRMRERNQQIDFPASNFGEKVLPFYNSKGEAIGSLTAIYPTIFVGAEDEFFSKFNMYLILVSILMTVVAVILSLVFSNRLTKGLRQVSRATKELKSNRFDMRIPVDHHVKEVDELAEGVNELAISLKKGEELRKQFTSDLTHELRTPLAALRSQIESFQDGIFEPTGERLAQCHHQVMRLVRLVDEMEKLHTVENPNLPLQIQPLSVKEKINALSLQYEPIFVEKGLDFSIDIQVGGTFLADPDRFMQMMTNLLNNALKYTPSGGAVQLIATDAGEDICFVVKDNGQGMPKEELDHIFERFYRGEKSRNRNTGGLGIGLSIVKALVDAHKGKIEIESEKHRGTTVKVYLKKAS